MPSEFEAGVLYVSKEFGIAGHLCACGCGNKVMTPIGGAEWSIKEEKRGVSMYPSIGNGQLDCKSHYLIRNGKIIWCHQMTKEWTISDMNEAEYRRRTYYNSRKKSSKFISWIKSIFVKLFK